jgi:hypothetical protein
MRCIEFRETQTMMLMSRVLFHCSEEQTAAGRIVGHGGVRDCVRKPHASMWNERMVLHIETIDLERLDW